MSARRLTVIVASGALVVGGGGAAIAAVSAGGAHKTEDAILADAAKRLNVAPDKLQQALSDAENAQLEQAVKDGKLTRKQADAIKQQRKQSGAVLGPPLGPGFRHGGRFAPDGPEGPGGPGLMHPGGRGMGLFSDLAKALGLSDDQLLTKLRGGKSVADIAKAQGKSLDSVRSAVKAAAQARAATAVKAGDLTRTQADALLQRLDKRLANLDKVPRLFGGRDERPLPAPGPSRPGSFAPAPEQPPALAAGGGAS